MNRHSIFFKLNMIFSLTIVSLIFIFILFIDVLEHKNKQDFSFKVINLHRMVALLSKNGDIEGIKEILKYKNIDIVKNKNISQYGQNISDKFRAFKPLIKVKKRDLKMSSNISIIKYKNDIYIHSKGKFHNLFLKYNNSIDDIFLPTLLVIFLLLIFLLAGLYIVLRKNLLTLKIVQNGIKKYKNGEIDAALQNNNQDEISNLSNTLYETIIKLSSIEESRKLLLRNMIHELKTPLTKSKLYLGFMDESKNRDRLENGLNKLELLINEMVNIEKISADSIELNKKEYRFIDILDNAIDSLFLEEDLVEHQQLNRSINVDFNSFSIVLKNLLDNGIKYSFNKKVKIDYTDNKISIISIGNKLPFTFDKYIEPFFKGNFNEENQKGFGLGLYIVDKILKKHNFKFNYIHKNENNIFEILI